jgi:hypothetical protein
LAAVRIVVPVRAWLTDPLPEITPGKGAADIRFAAPNFTMQLSSVPAA